MAAVRTRNPYTWLALGCTAARLVPAAFCVALCVSLLASLLGLLGYNSYAGRALASAASARLSQPGGRAAR